MTIVIFLNLLVIGVLLMFGGFGRFVYLDVNNKGIRPVDYVTILGLLLIGMNVLIQAGLYNNAHNLPGKW